MSVKFRAVTQKAKGLEIIQATAPALKLGFVAPPLQAVLPHDMPDQACFPLFARPAPLTPKHGFVESRLVHSLQELLDTYVEAKKADSQAEVICMPKLTAKVSGIATEAGIVWALGHDGATAGKGLQIVIPAPSPELTNFINANINVFGAAQFNQQITYPAKNNKLLEHNYFKNTYSIPNSVYIELVEERGKIAIVQLRDGPKPPAAKADYIPHNNYLVNSFIDGTPDEDMLAWESKISAAPVGTVVRLRGSSLSSHQAVHAIARGIAVLTSEESIAKYAVGMPIKKSGKEAKLGYRDYIWMAKQVGNWRKPLNSHAVIMSCAVLHSMMHWDNSKHLMHLRVLGAEIMARALASACAGEARHFYRCGPGSEAKASLGEIDWPSLSVMTEPKEAFEGLKGEELRTKLRMHLGNTARETVLKKASGFDLRALERLAYATVEDLHAPGWGSEKGDHEGRKHGSCSYGGAIWARSAEIARELISALRSFKRSPNEVSWNKIVLLYNLGVNAAHNGGHVLDKWCSWNRINEVCQHPVMGFMTREAMRFAGDLLKVSLRAEEAVGKGIFQADNDEIYLETPRAERDPETLQRPRKRKYRKLVYKFDADCDCTVCKAEKLRKEKEKQKQAEANYAEGPF